MSKFEADIYKRGYKYDYKYDDNRNRIEDDLYGPAGKLLSKVIYKRNNNYINLIEHYMYSSAGKLLKKEIYKCDSDGNINLIESEQYSPDGEFKYIYKYNKGELLSKKFFKCDIKNEKEK